MGNNQSGIVKFSEDKPLIHYGLLRFQEAVIQQYSQLVKNETILITVIIKESETGEKMSQAFKSPKKDNYWLTIERAFMILTHLQSVIRREKPFIINKDFRLSTWDDILDFFTNCDEFNTWVEKIG